MKMKLTFASPVFSRCLFAVCLCVAVFTCHLRAQDTQLPQPETEKHAPSEPQTQRPQTQAHDAQEEVQINERTRTFVIHLPQGYDSQQHYPVVIMLHGRDQDAAEMARLTHFNQVADQDGIVAVYPNALNGRWTGAAGVPPNYRRGPYGRGPYGRGPGYPPGPRNDPQRREGAARGPQDIPFLNRVLDKVVSHYSVDTRRIYAIGLGEGGFMAMRMGCNMADRIAAFATVAAAMPKNLNCIPSRPIPVLLMNGTDDHIVHYGGGRYKDGMLELLSAEDSAKEWGRLNRCAEKPTESKLPALEKGGKETRVYLFDGCRETSQVALYAVKDGGHTWPGGEQYMTEKEIGKTSNAINANETIWSFLVTRKISGESGVEK